MGREGAAAHGVRVVFTSCRDLKQPKIYVFALYYMFILYKQSLQWWFRCIRLQVCVGLVCVGDAALMCLGRECARLGLVNRRVSFYLSLVGGGLRLSGPSLGRNGCVRVYRSDM